MTRCLVLLLSLAIIIAPIPVFAADEPDTAPLMVGKPAPWSGVLVREGRFAKMLKLQVDVEELTVKLQIREKLFNEAVSILQKQLANAQIELNKRAAPDPWYKSHWFIFCLGAVIGAGLVIGAVLGAAQWK